MSKPDPQEPPQEPHEEPPRAKLNPKEENVAKIKAWRETLALNVVGAKQPDETILVGRLPDGKKLYTMEKNATMAMDFNAAAAYVQRANNNKMQGHDDWRLPTKEELALIHQNKDKGVLKGTFDLNARLEEQTDGDYWSSTCISPTIPLMYMKRLTDGSGCQSSPRCQGVVRLVR